MMPAVCLDPAKAQKKPNPGPEFSPNHEQRRASAGKLCLRRYPTSHTGLVQRIPKTIARYKWLFSVVQGYGTKRRLAARFARKLLRFANRIPKHAANISAAAVRVELNCAAAIQQTRIVTADDLNSFLEFRAVLNGVSASIVSFSDAAQESRAGVESMMGVSRDMNIAVTNLTDAIGQLVLENNTFVERLARLDALCASRESEMQLAP